MFKTRAGGAEVVRGDGPVPHMSQENHLPAHEFKDGEESGIVQGKALKFGVKFEPADAGGPQTDKLRLPVGEVRVDGAKGNQTGRGGHTGLGD